MSNLNRKNSSPVVDVVYNEILENEKELMNNPPEDKPNSKLTVKEKKEIITTYAEALGIELSQTQIKSFMVEVAKEAQTDKNDFRQLVNVAIAAYKQRLSEQTDAMMTEIANEFVEVTNQSNKEFGEKVTETFRTIKGRIAEANSKQKGAYDDLRQSLADGSIWD